MTAFHTTRCFQYSFYDASGNLLFVSKHAAFSFSDGLSKAQAAYCKYIRKTNPDANGVLDQVTAINGVRVATDRS